MKIFKKILLISLLYSCAKNEDGIQYYSSEKKIISAQNNCKKWLNNFENEYPSEEQILKKDLPSKDKEKFMNPKSILLYSHGLGQINYDSWHVLSDRGVVQHGNPIYLEGLNNKKITLEVKYKIAAKFYNEIDDPFFYFEVRKEGDIVIFRKPEIRHEIGEISSDGKAVKYDEIKFKVDIDNKIKEIKPNLFLDTRFYEKCFYIKSVEYKINEY